MKKSKHTQKAGRKGGEGRKGARRTSDISPKLQRELDRGQAESVSLVEALAVDFVVLLKHVAPDLPRNSTGSRLGNLGYVKRMVTVGEMLASHYGLDGISEFAKHRSDTVRGWAAFMASAIPGLSLRKRLALVRPLADDDHFGVREWAWLALRGEIIADIARAIKLLTPWTRKDSANLRRFASEGTRPRGVWCAHSADLKKAPELGLPILEPLRSDPSRYVQDSVANWLNDASKASPDWVRDLCERWQSESDSEQTSYIVRRACRSLPG